MASCYWDNGGLREYVTRQCMPAILTILTTQLDTPLCTNVPVDKGCLEMKCRVLLLMDL
jgi:hypothetical protein